MQYGSLTTCRRKNGPAVWSFRWWEVGATGKRVRRRMVIGTVTDLRNRIVAQRVGICKTEASQKPVPLHDLLVESLAEWRCRSRYGHPEDWVFASSKAEGRRPYWPSQLMRKHIKPIAHALGIGKPIGWHTFRHTYSTLLKSTGADLKVMQELMRHASARLTLDHYTQAVTPAKRAAQAAVLSLLFPADETTRERTQDRSQSRA